VLISALLPAERRAVRRQSGEYYPITFTLDLGEVVCGRTRDLSIMGVGILTTRFLPLGTPIEIRVPTWGKMPATCLPAEVKHAIIQADGSWVLGSAFSRFLTLRDMSAFG